MKNTTKNKRKQTRIKVYLIWMIVLGGVFLATDLPAQNKKSPNIQQDNKHKISGIIKDSEGIPLIGVAVVEKGNLKNGTVTDIEGKFDLIISGGGTIICSYVGYKTQEIIVESPILDIVMADNVETLADVVVVGHGIQKKESITAALTTVATNELIKSPVSNVSNALAGRVPGLTMIQKSGEPGKDQSTMRIRGIGTLSDQLSSPLIIIDGVERESMDAIDMNEIESISVLKDASATAVYGVRGANGVIIISTKTGGESKPVVSFSSNVGIQQLANSPAFLSNSNYARLKDEGLENDGMDKVFTDMYDKFDGSDPIFFPTRDLYSTFIKKTSLRHQHNVNITGGTKMVKYFVSLGYMSQEGQYNTEGIENLNIGFDPNPLYERYNVRANVDLDITKDLSISVKLGNQLSYANYPNQDTESLFLSFLQTTQLSGGGIYDGKLVSGYLNDPMGSFLPSRTSSPALFLLQNGANKQKSNTLNLNIGAKYKLDKLTKGLSIRAMFAYDNYYTKSETRSKEIDRYSVYKDPETNENRLIQTHFAGEFTNYNVGTTNNRIDYFEAAIDYDRAFGLFKVTGLFLYNQRKRRNPTLLYNVPEGLQGLVGRATVSYANKYLAEFNIGYNGSENFPEGKRFGVFPAYSLGWVPTEEAFFPKNEIINYIKIRGSYGEVGNDKIGGSRFLYLPSVYSYTSAPTYNFGTYMVDQLQYSGAVEGKLGNPNVTWEKAVKKNIGADIRLFSENLTINGDLFKEDRDNILINRATIPTIVGVTSLPAINMGKVTNHGYELSVRWDGKVRDFTYYIGANYAYAKNKILFKDEANALYPWMMQTGFSVGQLKGYKTSGLYNYYYETESRPYNSFYGNKVQQGDIKYIDIDGDGIIDQNDVVPIGYSTYPEINYGITLGAQWKNFDIFILFQGASHNALMQTSSIGWAFDNQWRQTLNEHLNRWNQERFDNGEKITMPRLSSDGSQSPNSVTSDYWLHNADYLRLKNIEIGYSFPSKWISKMGISSFRAYVNGNNVFTFTKLKNFDPEYSGSTSRGETYPLIKVFNFGINLKF
ncbi:TonB-dependent receptor [uncultured Dysgonomonas sp.]|uniref:TonB-dependent receptor plug domain-containing protein n=1 Tax=uncultured Dysgonomonas sp. TaxID=206096 RepID=A0A212JCR0_9BACT|nr:TonB-dependent receptor [uncultured Dysgonomonas sp.]SBV97221.1 conserved exported hypothetical protein [uncultured Dysgonomonas sp.]